LKRCHVNPEGGGGISTETDPVSAARLAGSDERPNKRLKKPTAVLRAGHPGAMRPLLLFCIQSVSYARVPPQASSTGRAALFPQMAEKVLSDFGPDAALAAARMP
jgi:hypothetical protein